MATETLTFLCPHCDIRLTVPARLAGVKGPCPSCRMSITAPVPDPGPSPFETSAEPPAVEPSPSAESIPAALAEDLSPPLPPAPVEAAIEDAPPAAEEHPVPVPVEVMPEPPSSGTPVPDGTKIKPEPRHAKERALAGPIQTRHSTADDRMKRQEPIQLARGRSSGRLVHALVPALFCAAATTVSYLLLYFYLPSGPGKRLRDATAPLAVPPPPPPEIVTLTPEPAKQPDLPPASAPAPGPPPVSGAAAPSMPPPAPAPAPSNPPADDGISPALVANELLEAFLRAKDARTRFGMVEPESGIAELEAMPLMNGPLWEVEKITTELPQHHPEEQVTDYPYRVTFFVPNRKSVDFSMLVRQRGTQSPKVFLPAFLDLAGGRLHGFTRAPNTLEPATFHVVIEPVPGCHEEGVPNPDRKFTIRLLPSTIGKETSRAYVSAGSRFKKMVEDPASSLRWGVRIRATVTLQWNHKEDPEKPYLELIDINSLGWNP